MRWVYRNGIERLDAAGKSFKEGLRRPEAGDALLYRPAPRTSKATEGRHRELQGTIRLQPEHVPSHYNLVILLADNNASTQRSMPSPGDQGDKNTLRRTTTSGSLARQGKVADAIPCFREALRCNSDYPLARSYLARSLNETAWSLVVPMEASRADAERAVKMVREAVELTPKDADPWNTLGLSYYRAGKWDEAIVALKKSASISKTNDWCDFLFLAMAHWKKGDKAEARTWYDRGVARIREQKINTEDSRRFQAEAAALLGLAKESK